MPPVVVEQPVQCKCGFVVSSGLIRPEELVLCPRCGRDCSVAPGPQYRLRRFFWMLKRKRQGLSALTVIESYQLPRERRSYRDNQEIKRERERTGVKRLGQTGYSRDPGGSSREFGCNCPTCRPAEDLAAGGPLPSV